MKYIRNWEKWIAGKTRAQILKKIIEMHEKIETDELTGLYNRRAFKRELKFSIANYRRYKISFCILNLDLKKFKNINDTLGHAEGDRALIFFAEYIQTEVRDTDLPFRISGDEFAVILNHTKINQAEIFVKRFLENLEIKKNMLTQGDVGKMVNASYAVSQWKLKDSPEEFLKNLDVKMYEQKRS